MNRISTKKTFSADHESVENLLADLEPPGIESGDSVLVKPNICYYRNTNSMILSDFHLIESTIRILKKTTKDIIVVESDNKAGTADERAARSGLLDLLKPAGVEFKNLSSEEKVDRFGYAGGSFSVPKIVTDADHLVNICKMKTCVGPTVSLSLKNTFGLVAEKSKPKMHKYLDEILLKINQAIKNQLILVDGIVGMEGNGPLLGDPVNLGILVAGLSPGTVDSVCSRMMGFDPIDISHIRLACEKGLGQIDTADMKILGEPLKTMHKFRPPSFSPVSVLRTVRSAARVYSP